MPVQETEISVTGVLPMTPLGLFKAYRTAYTSTGTSALVYMERTAFSNSDDIFDFFTVGHIFTKFSMPL